MTDFRAKGTIIGLTGLTAVFGMGTGGTPSVSSPEMRPYGGQAIRTRFRWLGHVQRAMIHRSVASTTPHLDEVDGSLPIGSLLRFGWCVITAMGSAPHRGEGSERIGVVKRLAVRTGRLRRSLAVHSRPIDLVVFQEPSH